MDKLLKEAQARFEEDEEKQDLFCAYNDIDTFNWTPPSGWTAKEEMRIRVSSIGHDGLKQATNIFQTYNPKWEVLPRSNADADNAEEVEAWVEFMTLKANNVAEVSPFAQGSYNAAKYLRTIYHVDYLPYWLPADKSKWSKEQKANAANGPYCITCLDPRNFYYSIGKYGLKWVMNLTNICGQEIIDQWSVYESKSEEGKQISAGLKKIKISDDKEEDQDYIYVDITSVDRRLCIAIPTTSEGVEDFENFDFESGEYITILNGENKLGFIPYSVATGDGDPLLHSMHVSNAWVNQNIIESIVDTSILRRAFIPPFIHKSDVGDKDMDVNFSGETSAVELRQGESAQTTNLPPLDPGLQQLLGINTQRIANSVGIQNLAMNDIAGNVQFSTVQAQIQLQLTALQPYKRCNEKAMAGIPVLMLKWLEVGHAEGRGGTEIARRSTARTKKPRQYSGMPITLSGDTVDPENMIITCELLSAAPTDRQQLVNMAVTMDQAGYMIPQEETLERLGYKNPAQMKEKWFDEQVQKLALSFFGKNLDAELNVKVQKAIAEIQAGIQQQLQAAQQPQQQGQPSPEQMAAMAQQGGATPPQGDAISQGGQEQNPAAGGQPPMAATPGLTRNNVRNPG